MAQLHKRPPLGAESAGSLDGPESRILANFEQFLLSLNGGALRDQYKRDWAVAGHTFDFFFPVPMLGVDVFCGDVAWTSRLLEDPRLRKMRSLEQQQVTYLALDAALFEADPAKVVDDLRQAWRDGLIAQRGNPPRLKGSAAPDTSRIKANPSALKAGGAGSAAVPRPTLRRPNPKSAANNSTAFNQALIRMASAERDKNKGGERNKTAVIGGRMFLEQDANNFPKRYVDEGIAGTRDENKLARGRLFSDAKKRGRGD